MRDFPDSREDYFGGVRDYSRSRKDYFEGERLCQASGKTILRVYETSL